MTEVSNIKSRAAVLSMAVSALLAIAKFVVALMTGSLGILSEALHSLIDFGATIVTWFAVVWADVPADDDHHYGHAKIESVAALFEASLLALTAVYVAYTAIQRLWLNAAPPEITWWAPALIILAIAVDYNRAAVLSNIATEQESAALAADAAHFKSDMFGSVAVLIGLGGIALGFGWADSVAALAVAGLILWIARRLAGDALATLLDRAPEGISQEIKGFAEREDGVLHVEQLRIRQAGKTSYISLVADVPRSLAANQIVALENRLTSKISSLVRRPDIGIVLRPVALDSESVNEKVNAIARGRGLSIHHVIVQNLAQKLAVSFDVEFDGSTPLFDAHEQATEIEEAIRDGLGGNVEVESHIEPRPMQEIEGRAVSAIRSGELEAALRKLAIKETSLSDIHDFRVRQDNAGNFYLHYHCHFAPEATIEMVHAVLDRLEGQLQLKFSKVVRVIAHAEPNGRTASNSIPLRRGSSL